MHLYDLAYALGKTRAELDHMDYQEIQGWFNYFQRRPIGWRDDLRASYLMNAQGVQKKPEEIFPAIKQLKDEESKDKAINATSEKRTSSPGSLENSMWGKLLTSRGLGKSK